MSTMPPQPPSPEEPPSAPRPRGAGRAGSPSEPRAPRDQSDLKPGDVPPPSTAKAIAKSAGVAGARKAADKIGMSKVVDAAATIGDKSTTAHEKVDAAVTGAATAAAGAVTAVATGGNATATKAASKVTGKVMGSKKGRKFLVAWIAAGVFMPLIVLMMVISLVLSVAASIMQEEDEEAARSRGSDTVCESGVVNVAQPNGLTFDDGVTMSADHISNGRAIIEKGKEMQVPEFGIIIALATAMQESALTNIEYGDAAGPDSRGLFQQRDSWGTLEERMDPKTSAGFFYERLLRVEGWQSMELTRAAQAVQISAHPDLYASHEGPARNLYSYVTGSSGMDGCGGATISDCPASTKYASVENRLSPDALLVLRCTVAQFNIEWNIGGYGARPLNPQSDHATGRAIDFMIHDWQQTSATGDTWSRWLQDNASALGINYLIWDAKWWSAGDPVDAWKPYAHPSGATDATNMHLDHIHVSVHGNAGTGMGDAGSGAVSGEWAFPASAGAVFSSPFGMRFHPIHHEMRMHEGIDLASGAGKPIYAASGGTVIMANWWVASAGNTVQIDHGNGVVTRYLHLSGFEVSVGDTVQPGQLIAREGATGGARGVHLHFEVIVNGSPIDPKPFLEQKGVM